MARPRVHGDELRGRLLDTAGRVVTATGVASLTLRGLAAAEGTSTTAVYSLFGGKPALLSALFERAFSSFGRSQREVPVTDDPVADLDALGTAYRTWALTNPHLYAVMFSGALSTFDPSAVQMAQAGATIEPLRNTVQRGCDAGFFAGDPETLTFTFWAVVHGVVSLILAGCAPPAYQVSAVHQAAVGAVVRGMRAPVSGGSAPRL